MGLDRSESFNNFSRTYRKCTKYTDYVPWPTPCDVAVEISRMAKCEHLAAKSRGEAKFDWAERSLKQERNIPDNQQLANWIWRQWVIWFAAIISRPACDRGPFDLPPCVRRMSGLLSALLSSQASKVLGNFSWNWKCEAHPRCRFQLLDCMPPALRFLIWLANWKPNLCHQYRTDS